MPVREQCDADPNVQIDGNVPRDCAGLADLPGRMPRKRGGPREGGCAAGGDASESAPKDHELLDDETVVDETDLARFQLHLCRLNNEDPLGLDAAHAVHDVLRRRPAIHELLSEALGGSSCNRRAKLSSR